MKYIKYPRTPHVPWSPGVQSDDITTNHALLSELLEKHQVVITEKMDGECTTMYTDHIHARSVSSGYHPSRSRVKGIHANIAHLIPSGWRICGENLQAVHSIEYNQLPDWFLAFSVWNEHNQCLDWTSSMDWFELMGLKPVPVLYCGHIDLNQLAAFHKGLLPEQEGYVIRNADYFDYESFDKNTFKWVRPNHVQTDQHWMQSEMIENRVIC